MMIIARPTFINAHQNSTSNTDLDPSPNTPYPRHLSPPTLTHYPHPRARWPILGKPHYLTNSRLKLRHKPPQSYLPWYVIHKIFVYSF